MKDPAQELQPVTDRSRLPQSELTSFLAPLIVGMTGLWQRFHFVTLGVLGLYAFSGTTVIEANQVGVILRLGEVVRSDGEPVIYPPGIVLAFPQPFDEVLTVEVDRIYTLIVNDLAAPSWQSRSLQPVAPSTREAGLLTPFQSGLTETIDPEEYGYVLTGDRNIIHAQIIVRYRIKDPIEYALLTSTPSDFLRAALLQSTVKTAGETGLDDLLSSGREQFSRTVNADAQSRMDRIGTGLEIVSLEYANLSPPEQVAIDFDAVQSAYIEAETTKQDALSYASSLIPRATASAGEIVRQAESAATSIVSIARADAQAFVALFSSYQTSPVLVQQRLYRDGIENALNGAERLKLVPAPPDGGYQGTRFSISIGRLPRQAEVRTNDTRPSERPQETDKDTDAGREEAPLLSLLSLSLEEDSQ